MGVLFLIIGLCLLGYGVLKIFNRRRQAAQSRQTMGVVKSLIEREGDEGSLWHPQVEFQTAEGARAHFVSELGTQRAFYSVGQQVKIIYNPRNPAQAEINSFWALYFVPVIFLFIGGIFTIVGGSFAVVCTLVLLAR